MMRLRLSHQLLSSSLAGLLAVGLSIPVVAQQQSGTGDDRDSRRYDQNQPSQTRDRSQQQNDNSGQQDRQENQRDQQSRDGLQVRVEPQGWVRIAVDRNNDGRFDAIETIFLYDLQVAQQRSRQRQQEEQQRIGQDRRRGQEQQRDYTGRQYDQERQGQTQELRGTIQELTTKWLPERGEGRYIVARVRTNEGRSEQVLLGSRNELRRLDLDRGDSVSISGRRGTVNDETMVIARQVESDGMTVRPETGSDDQSQPDQQRYAQRGSQDRSQSGQDSSTQRYDQQDRDQQDQPRGTQRSQQDRDRQDRDRQDQQRGTQRSQQDRD